MADARDLMIHGVQALLFALAIWSFARGKGPERFGAVLLIGAFLGRRLIDLLGFPYTYDQPSMVHLAFALALFLASLGLAVRSNRVWPLFFSALFLIQLTGFLSVTLVDTGRSYAFWIMTQVPVIAQTAILAWATVLHLERTRRGVRAPDWRLKVSR